MGTDLPYRATPVTQEPTLLTLHAGQAANGVQLLPIVHPMLPDCVASPGSGGLRVSCGSCGLEGERC